MVSSLESLLKIILKGRRKAEIKGLNQRIKLKDERQKLRRKMYKEPVNNLHIMANNVIIKGNLVIWSRIPPKLFLKMIELTANANAVVVGVAGHID
jgi:hypothetical protein